MTEIYLSHWSALKSFNIKLVNEMFPEKLEENTHTPQYIAFGKKPRKKGAESERVEYIKKKTPKGAVLPRKGTVSPEFAFLQVAYDLTFQERVALGKALCSTPNGNPYEAATTAKKLKRFIRQCKNHRGRKAALQAIKYILNEARSSMEIYTFMFLCLPNKWGGAGFTDGVFNQELHLTTPDGTRRIYADIAFPEQKLVIEYNGKDHETDERREYDMTRKADLEANGYTVIIVTRYDIYNLRRLTRLIERVGDALKKKRRFTTQHYAQGFLKIFAMLPGDHSAIADLLNPSRRGREFLKNLPRKFRIFFERLRVPLRLLNTS